MDAHAVQPGCNLPRHVQVWMNLRFGGETTHGCAEQGTDTGDFIPHLLDDIQLLNKAADTSVQARSPLIDIFCSLDASRHLGGVSIGCREVRDLLGSIVDLLTPRGLSASVKKDLYDARMPWMKLFQPRASVIATVIRLHLKIGGCSVHV